MLATLLSLSNGIQVKVIKAIHGQEGGFDTYGFKFNGIWARIVGSSNFLHSKNIISLKSLRFKVGFYRLELDKDCLIRIRNGQWSWNWSRNDLEVCNTTYFKRLVDRNSRVNISTVGDTCIWSLAKDDIFSVKEARRVIDDKILPSLATSTSCDKTLPRKVNIFMWRLILDRLRHRLNLLPRESTKLHPAQTVGVNHIVNSVTMKLEMETNQYASWAELFNINFHAYDVIDHLTSETPPPPKDKELAMNPEMWSRLDIIVLQWIYATISKDLMHTFLEPDTTAKKAWDRLKDIFQDNKNSRALSLEHLFSNTHLDSFSNISSYCQELKMLADQLANVAAPVLNQRLVLQLIACLNESYDGVATIIQQSDPLPTFYDACSKLILEETRKNRQAAINGLTTGSTLITTVDNRDSKQPVNGSRDTSRGNGYQSNRGGGRGGSRNGGRGGRHGGRGRGCGSSHNNSGHTNQLIHNNSRTTHAANGPRSPTWTNPPAWAWKHYWASMPPSYAATIAPLVAHYPLYAPTDIKSAMHTMTLNPPDDNWYVDTGASSHMATSQVKDYKTGIHLMRCDSSGDLYPLTIFALQKIISSNPRNRHIAQPGMNMGQDRQMQMVGGNGGNQFRQYTGQNAGNPAGYNDVIRNQNQIGNGNLVTARAEGNAAGQNGNQIRCYNCRGLSHHTRNCTEYDLMAAAADLDEIEEVNANCILMANLQQASTPGTQTDSAPVYDTDGSTEYTKLLEPIPESQQVPQNDNVVISKDTSVEQGGETVEQHPVNFEETPPHQDQSSFNQNYLQQPMPNPEDITDPTTAMNMALALMAKAFKLNYSTLTNNNQIISSNPRNMQIAQPGMNMGQDRQMHMVGGNGGNQFRQYVGQNAGNPAGYNNVIGNQNGNLVAARAEGNTAGQNGNQIRCYNCRGVGHYARNCTVRPRKRDAAYLQTQLLIAQKEEARIQLQAEEHDLMAAAADLDEIKEVNANCILMANLQQASTSGTQTDSAPVYDTDGSAKVHKNCDDNEIFNMFTQEEQYTELLEPIPKSHQVPQNDNEVISEVTSMEQGGETVQQHPVNFEETRALYKSLYHNLAIEVEKVNSVNRKLKETNTYLTTELARFKNQEICFEISQEKYDKLERCYQKSVYQEQCLSKKINALYLSSEEILQLAQESRDKMKQMNKEIKPENYTKINNLLGVFVPQKALSRKDLYFSNNSKTANVSKSFLIPNEDLSDDTTPSVARKFLNEVKSTIVTLQRVVKQRMTIETHNWASSAHQELHKIHKALELEIECLLKAFVSHDIMIIVQNESVVDTSDLQTELEYTRNPLSRKLENENVELEFRVLNYARENAYLKATYKNLFDSISVSRAQTKTTIASLQNELQSNIYKNAKLRTQLFKKVSDQKDNTQDSSENTKFAKQPIVENLPKIGETNALSKPVTSNLVSTPQESKGMNNDKVIAPGMFKINPNKTSMEAKKVPNTVRASNRTKLITVSQPPVFTRKDTSREEKHVPNSVNASNRTKPITVSQPPVITKKNVNSDLNILSSTRIDNTKTRRPQPRSNTKNDRVPFASKSSQSKNKEAEVEAHHRNLLLSKNNKHISSACNNIQSVSECYSDLFMVHRFGLFQAYDRKSKASQVYFVKGLGHNLFSVGQFYDSDLEVAFKRNACFVKNLEGVDLLK
nr:hypothetical protein [Tanacetum cinerariifolium]